MTGLWNLSIAATVAAGAVYNASAETSPPPHLYATPAPSNGITNAPTGTPPPTTYIPPKTALVPSASPPKSTLSASPCIIGEGPLEMPPLESHKANPFVGPGHSLQELWEMMFSYGSINDEALRRQVAYLVFYLMQTSGMRKGELASLNKLPLLYSTPREIIENSPEPKLEAIKNKLKEIEDESSMAHYAGEGQIGAVKAAAEVLMKDSTATTAAERESAVATLRQEYEKLMDQIAIVQDLRPVILLYRRTQSVQEGILIPDTPGLSTDDRLKIAEQVLNFSYAHDLKRLLLVLESNAAANAHSHTPPLDINATKSLPSPKDATIVPLQEDYARTLFKDRSELAQFVQSMVDMRVITTEGGLLNNAATLGDPQLNPAHIKNMVPKLRRVIDHAEALVEKTNKLRAALDGRDALLHKHLDAQLARMSEQLAVDTAAGEKKREELVASLIGVYAARARFLWRRVQPADEAVHEQRKADIDSQIENIMEDLENIHGSLVHRTIRRFRVKLGADALQRTHDSLLEQSEALSRSMNEHLTTALELKESIGDGITGKRLTEEDLFLAFSSLNKINGIAHKYNRLSALVSEHGDVVLNEARLVEQHADKFLGVETPIAKA